ncbi:MAG: phosphotransferase [Bacteroidales bacterium]|nr:phosphotransferase [Bacteroidales bacterium]
MERLLRLYEDCFGPGAAQMEPLPGSGSHRRYFRLTDGGRTVIGVIGTDPEENRAFVTEARHFRGKGIPVPEIYAVTGDGLCYLQEDLGRTSLYDRVAEGRKTGSYSESEAQLLCKAIAGLPRIQFEGAQGLDFNVCYPDTAFNARMVDFDLNYFKYCYLKTAGIEFKEIPLQDDFDRLRADLLAGPSDTFLYRDFQARNVMVRDGEPWYIDFQGGRKGPVWYDVASFVYQARARYPQALKERLIHSYLEALAPYARTDGAAFREKLRLFVLFRTLQVLGAYGYRGKFEKKTYFLESIPYAMENLREILEQPFDRYPYLDAVLREMAATPAPPLESGALEVQVCSFSFRKGIPEDPSGHGGGYVFDCRGMHNPGRYEQYRQSTGRDRDVIDFLESRGEVQRFLDHVFGLVDPHVERYIRRGFNHLQVSFGCTGGQHRSVYCAEALARHLHEKFRIRVRLIHQEQDIDLILP